MSNYYLKKTNVFTPRYRFIQSVVSLCLSRPVAARSIKSKCNNWAYPERVLVNKTFYSNLKKKCTEPCRIRTKAQTLPSTRFTIN